MKEKIKKIMSLVFEIPSESIEDNATIDVIENWDSLNHMNLIVALEEDFNVRFTDEDILHLLSLPKIEERIQMLTK